MFLSASPFILFFCMKHNSTLIQQRIDLSIQESGAGKALLARTFAEYIRHQSWITDDMKIEFCILFLNSILDRSYNPTSDTLNYRLRKTSIHVGIRLLKRYPRRGLEVLVNLVLDELIDTQNYAQDDLFQFYNLVFLQFFPEKTNSLALKYMPSLQPV
jgi:hypothetical protein